MSRPIYITDVINHITPSHNRISQLILGALKFEEKLKHPEDQSFYFRLAMRNNDWKLDEVSDSYDRLRKEFNEWTVDELIAEKEEEERILREKVPNVRPYFARAFYKGAVVSRIRKYDDYLSIKSITEELPTWEELKNDHELLTSILDT